MHAANEEQSVPLDLQIEDLDRADADGVVEEIEVALDVHAGAAVPGLPGDSCEGVMPIQCTHLMSPLGAVCRGEDVLSCVCPGLRRPCGGVTVRVAPGEREAWLDFTAGGSIAGRVVRTGRPRPVGSTFFRLPSTSRTSRGGASWRERADAIATAPSASTGWFQGTGTSPSSAGTSSARCPPCGSAPALWTSVRWSCGEADPSRGRSSTG